MKKTRLYTFTWLTALLSTIPLLALIFVLLVYTIERNNAFRDSTIRQSEDVVISSIDAMIDDVIKKTDETVQSMNFLYFANTSNREGVNRYVTMLQESLESSLYLHQEVAGIVFFNSQIERHYNYFADTSYSSIIDDILPHMEGDSIHRSSQAVLHSKDGLPYILYVVGQRYGCMAVLIDPSLNTSYRALVGNVPENCACFLSTQETVSDTAGVGVITGKLSDFSVYLQYTVNRPNPLRQMDSTQITIFILVCVMVFFIVFLWIKMQKQLLTPLNRLAHAFSIISQGDSAYRLSRKPGLYEIEQIYMGFNRMLDNIHAVEEESRRQQIGAVQAKLQYLQLQIRPHFYLNCLKNINSLAEMHEDEKIQQLVIFLSDYFRYSFQDVRSFVSMREELEAVQSYVNLCKCLYRQMELQFHISSDVLDDKCLPLSILTFVENSVKHGKYDAGLVIAITSRVILNGEGTPFTVTTVSNTGGRFPDEVLEELNGTDPSVLCYRREKVGISNVRYRLWLTYQETASLTFRNEGNCAVVEISVPSEPFNQENEGV